MCAAPGSAFVCSPLPHLIRTESADVQETQPSTSVEAPSLGRSPALDRVRGLALVLMLVDHVAWVAGDASGIRMTMGRLAMPLFFLLAGHLFTRLRRRHAVALAIGLFLPAVVPWIDSPNVLVLFAVGCGLLALANRWPWLLVAVPVVALTLAANRWVLAPGGYEPLAVIALMFLGARLPRSAFGWGERLPARLGQLGRWPLTFYVAHLLVLHALSGGPS